MKSLLKAADLQAQAGVRSLADGAQATRLVPLATPLEATLSPPPEALRIVELEAEVAVLETQAKDAAEASALREAGAYDRGLAEGARRAASRDDERLKMLNDGLAAAQEELSAGLVRLDILALEVAQTALAGIFGDEALYAGMVAATLRRQIAELQDTIVIRACVSPADFADQAAFDALAAEHPRLELACDPALDPGGCRIELRLGRLDAGIGGQWARLSALIDTLVHEGVDA